MNTHTPAPAPGTTLDQLVAELFDAKFLGDLTPDLLSTIQITGINQNSRRVTKGDLFVAIRGERADGHHYLTQAVQQGAAALLVEEPPPRKVADQVPTIVVNDTRAALAEVAAAFYQHPSKELKLIGITGTNGKTSLTFLLEGIITAAREVAGVIGTIEQRYGNYRFPKDPNTTPDSLKLQQILRQMVDGGATHVAMEVSSHGLVTHRVKGCHFAARVFTNLSRDHLDFHQDMDNYFKAKSTLFTHHRGGPSIINVDDPQGKHLYLTMLALTSVVSRPADQPPKTLIGYSLKRDNSLANVYPEEAILSEDGIDTIIRTPSGIVYVGSPLMGKINLENIVAAVAVGVSLGFSTQTIGEGLSSVDKIPGRLEKVDGSGGPHWPMIFVDYAHTPDALQKALTSLRETCSGELSVVFGCGGDRDQGKRPLMGAVAAQLADTVIVTSDNPRNEPPGEIIAQILAGMKSATVTSPPHSIPDRRTAIRTAVALAGPGDTILIAGKGHESTQTMGSQEEHFSDMEEAKQALAMKVVGSTLSQISGKIMEPGGNLSS